MEIRGGYRSGRTLAVVTAMKAFPAGVYVANECCPKCGDRSVFVEHVEKDELSITCLQCGIPRQVGQGAVLEKTQERGVR